MKDIGKFKKVIQHTDLFKKFCCFATTFFMGSRIFFDAP